MVQADVDAVLAIPAIPTILKVVCEATGMGFAAVARVTEDRWIACEVLDNVHFGLPAGGELKVETTLCNEVRDCRTEIVIDSVAEETAENDDIRCVLENVVDELRYAHPDRDLTTEIGEVGRLSYDPVRLAQLASNLVANAITHGDPNSPIHISAGIEDGHFQFAVSNSGEPIEAQVIESLFKPFFRANIRPSQQGLGLGLYIASQIAKAHGGELIAASSQEETRFTFRMPLKITNAASKYLPALGIQHSCGHCGSVVPITTEP